MNCKNCDRESAGRYCSECGQPVQLNRITNQYLISELSSLFFLEKGFFYTVRELIVRPGESVRNFLLTDRRRLIKPVVFIILTSLIYTLINHFFPFEAKYMQAGSGSKTDEIRKWVAENYGYSNLIMGVFIAFWIKLFFRKWGYYFIEILVLLCFVMGVGMLILAVFGFLEFLTGFAFMKWGGLLTFAYPAWAIGSFFQKRFRNYAIALAAYVAGILTFTTAATLLGTVLDNIRP